MAVNWGRSRILQGNRNPAAPAGLRQSGERVARDQQNYAQGRSVLQPWQPNYSMLETAKSWYTGANNQGVQNGWDTTFYKNAFNQYDQYQQKAMQANKPSTFYGWLDPNINKQATGVQTWGADPNDQAAKESGAGRFGDVYNNGKKVANLYDDYDKATADVMVGEFLFTNDEKKRAWNKPGMDPLGKPTLNPEYSAMVEEKRKQNTDQAMYAKSAESYQDRVKAQEVSLRANNADEKTIAGGALGGAALGAGAGAALGTVVPLVGNVVGGIVGGVVGAVAGGVGAYLNQDQLVEMEARASVKADEANKTLNQEWWQKATMNAGEYSQVAMKLISPVSNIWQGVEDVRFGKVGDMTSEFYATDPDGSKKVGWQGTAVDIAATLADGVLQFSSPLASWLYMGAMAGTVSGKVGEMTTGTVFNERRGQYDKLENWQEWSAAVGSATIDAAQLGVAGMFGKAASSSRALITGEKAANKASRDITGRIVMEEATFGDKAYAKVLGREAPAYATTRSGIRFASDETGKVVSTRLSMEMLAPSEGLRWIETGWQARRLAAIDKGAMTRDHLLKASIDLQENSRFRQAVLLGYSEGGEEFAQAYLDPKRTGDKGKFSDYYEAFLYGAAGGIGMGLGPNNRRPSSTQQMESRAFAQRSLQLGRVPTEAEWQMETKGAQPKDFEKMARTTPAEDVQTNQLLTRLGDNHRQETAEHSAIGLYRMDSMNQARFEQLNKKALEEGNGSLVLLGQSTEYLTTPQGTVDKNKYSANAGVMSADETINQLGLISKGTSAQLRKVEEELRGLPANSGDEHVQTLRAEMQSRQQDLVAQEQVSTAVSDHFLRLYDAFTKEANPTPDRLEQHLERMNVDLKLAYTGGWRDENGILVSPDLQKRVQRAVEIKLGRHPFQDRGSFAAVVPQISLELTRLNAAGQIHVPQGMLKAINGDHDGDTIVPLHTTYLDEDALGRIRRGDQYLQPTEDENGKTTVKVIIAPPDGEWAIMRSISDAMLDPTSRSASTTTTRLDGLLKQVKAEFSTLGKGPLDAAALDKILSKFKDSVLTGREDARMNMVTEMVNLDYPGMRNHRPDDNVPSVQWLWNKINETWDILTKDLAHVRATESSKPAITPQREARETDIRSEIARADAATASATLGMLTSDNVRGTQHLHYSNLYRGLVEFDPATSMTTDQQMRLTELFMELGNSQTDRDIELVSRRNAIEERVYYWLQQMAISTGRDTTKTVPEVMLLLANVSVPSVDMKAVNKFEVSYGETTMLQLLLRRSLDIEEAANRGSDPDSPEMKKIRSLRRLTYRDQDRSKRSTTASLAMIEVLGNRPMFELIGASSSYVGPQLTLNQLVQMQRGLHPTERNREWQRLKRQEPYIKTKDRGFKDAPWPVSVLSDVDTKISAYAIVMDAVKVAGDSYLPKMRDRNATVHKSFIDGIEGLHTAVDAHKKMHHERLAREGIITPIQILRDTLKFDARLAPDIATLIPDAAALGVFKIHPSGKVTASKWLEKMLVERNPEKAAAMYYYNIKLAEFNQRSGTMDMASLDQMSDEDRNRAISTTDVRGRIDPSTLKSRFLQVMFHLASQPDSIELLRFIKVMEAAPSVDKMFEELNNEPMWRNNQAELLPWYDDVSDFEVDPADTWSSQLEGALQRENIRGWGTRMQVIGIAATEAAVTFEANKNLLHGIEQWQKTRGNSQPLNLHEGATYGGLLKRAVENRKLIPDYQGQAARTQLVELQMVGIAATQNKGVADPKAAPFGEPLITLDSFGYSDGLRQELASLTAEDVEDVLTNLSLLAQGPVRMMMEDGRTLVFDITTDEKALAMLQDPRTQGLAMSILFPTVRDVDVNNTVQVYLDTDAKTSSNNKGDLAHMLREQNFKHLFNEPGDFESQLRQAHRYIGNIESYVRNKAVGNDNPEVQDKSFMPVQKAVHDFITAYLHSRDVKESNYVHVRDQMFIDIVGAIKSVAAVDPSARGRMRNTIAAVMEKRFLSDPTAYNQLLNDDNVSQQMEQIMLVTQQSDIFFQALDDIDARKAKATTQADKDIIELERDEFVKEWEQLHGNFGYEHLTFLDAASALSMFKVDETPGSEYNKAEILAFLGRAGRIHRVYRKDKYKFSGVEVNAQRLYEKYLRLYDQNPLDTTFAPEEWEVLGNWAAQIYLEDTTSRASSSVPSGPAWLGEEGAAVKRYSDQSWMYLTDPLFDEGVLEAATYLSQGDTHNVLRDSTEVAQELTNGILSERKLGAWSRIIVNESMKTRMILKNSTVGAAVAQEGNDPKVMADYLGSGKITWERPEAAHFSEAVLPGNENTRLYDMLTTNMALVKLENHFVSEVMIQSNDPNNPLDPALESAFLSVTQVNQTNEDTIAAGAGAPGVPPLRVLDLQKLDERLEWLKSPPYNLRDFTVTIKYVDVNKQPHERRWANNIYFDGVGREAVGGSSMGAVASLFFGLNGLNKIGQQNPLDAATKQGMSFKAHLRSSLDEVQNLQQSGSSVSDVLAAKAVHMLKKSYPMGELLRADLPSLYKLQKMRHVVVGTDANGAKQVWWAQQAIQMEESGSPISLQNWKLVELSDRVAQTLLGRSGQMGVRGTSGSLTRPTFNIQDLDTFPDLSEGRLARLGLSGIGEDVELGNTRLAQVNLPTREVSMYKRGEQYPSVYAKRLETWQGEAQEVSTRRLKYRDTGAGKLDITDLNQSRSQLIRNMLDAEQMAVSATQLGIPERGVIDYSALQVSRLIAARLTKMMESPNAMVWVHKHGAQGDLSKGVAGRADIKNNFAGFDGMGPTYNDVVVLDLADLMTTVDTYSYEQAAKEAAKILKVYAKKGVTVVLQSTGGQLDLRAKVTEDLVDGSLGYRPMAGSPHFFQPITEDAEFNAAQRALASSLLETKQFNTKNMSLRLVSDDISTNLSEATEYIDVPHDRTSHMVSHTILPYRLLSTGSVGLRNPLAFNIPQTGQGRANQLQKVNAELLPLLKSAEGRAYLKQVLLTGGPDRVRESPTDKEGGYPQYQEHPNGTITHGVLSIDDALDRLERSIEADKWPLEKGETFYWGTIVPFVSGDGSIHLARVGFKQPNHRQLKKQRDLRFGNAGKPMKISASTNTLDSNQSQPPPTRVDEVKGDGNGISVLGTYRPNALAKSIDEGLGLKTGQTPMPKGYSFPDVVIAGPGAPGMRPTRMAGSTSVVSKEAVGGLGNNFRDLFLITGINFEDDMINYFFGERTSRSEEERAGLWDMTQRILKDWSLTQQPYTETELARILDNRSAMMTLELQLNAIGRSVAKDAWNDVSLRTTKDTNTTPLSRLGTIILTTLAAPGVRLEHVISTPGATTVSSHDAGLLVRQLPSLMTDALADIEYPELRTMLVNRLNRNMPVDSNGDPEYWFDDQLKFHAMMVQDTESGPRKEEVVGFLQVHVPLPADENSIRNVYAGVDSSGPESQHVANTIAGAVGGRVATKTRGNQEGLPDVLDELYGNNRIERFEDPDDSAAAFFHMVTRLRINSPQYSPWQKRTPMEEEHHRRMQASLRQYGYEGDRNEKTGWSSLERTDGDRLANELLGMLKIRDGKAVKLVEEMARQLLGIPGPATDQEDYPERLSFKMFQTAVEYMKRNIEKGRNPLDGGMVPLPNEMTWKRIFDAQQGLPKGQQWLPLANGNRKGKSYAKADDWGEWVKAIHGQVRASAELFDASFRTDLDAFMYTYQGTHPDYMDMATTTDQLLAAKLLDPVTNEPYLSVDPGYDAVLREPIVLTSQYMTYDALVGKGAVTIEKDAEEASDSVLARRIATMKAWQTKEGLPKQKDTSVREYAKQGVAYQESSSSTSNLMRNMINLSVMVRLFNPALYFSAMFEVPFRSALEGATNIMTGQLTGTRGKIVAKVGNALDMKPRYSVDDINMMDQLNKSMGRSNQFKGLVYGELAYQSAIAGGRGKIGGLLERGAAGSALWTADPLRGFEQSSLAKRYNDAAWEYLSMSNAQITIEQYAFMMKNDPTWLADRDPKAHLMGLNAVKQARGAKNTMLGNSIMTPLDKMTKNKNLFVNGAGHLLKVPFLFTRFNANMLLTLSGLNGFDQVVAMFFDGRERPGVLKRMMNRAKQGEEDANTPEYWDNSDVIESIDLSRRFVSGFVTQTALMSMAMLAGGFSLGGEDEEERRRKRMATYLNTPYYHDPRRAANDFRWTDAIFLDNIPVLGNIYMQEKDQSVLATAADTLLKRGEKKGGIFTNETTHAAVVPHWIFRQFLSPVLGMMRFFENGDYREIAQGFTEAATVMPNSVARLWNEADLTTELLIEGADDDSLIPVKQDRLRQMATNVVFVYEKALFENTFINGLYQARDEYDRNPWAVTEMKNGTVVREPGTNEPVATKALRTALTGKEGVEYLKDKYMMRTGADATLHQYAEGNATAAVVLSILPWFQGQDSSYLRGNMVTKKQYVQLDPTPKDKMEALIYATYLGRGGQPTLTKEEIMGKIKLREQTAGRWWKQNEVEAEADKVFEKMKDQPLTIFDKGGKEVMTQDGKGGVFRSLKDGVMTLDNPAIRGFHMTQDERDALAEELFGELVQEGADLGLSDQSSNYRARRIWYGDKAQGYPGLKWILYDKHIPSKPYAEYDQLNVTYVLGPDGKPWATPFQRANVLQVLGVPTPSTMPPTIPGVTSYDERGNVIDLVRGINTGLAGVVPRPLADDIKANDDAIKKAEAKTTTPGAKNGWRKFPWRNFGRRHFGGFGRHGGGGGGGGGSAFGPPFSRMQPLEQGTSARINDVPMINTSSPIIRRADVRRERITSERGRLKQWQ